MEKANDLILQMEKCIANVDPIKVEGKLKVGVDLGTANIVITVLDSNDIPVAGAIYPADVVRDGIVVNFVEAVQIIRKLKAQLEKQLGRELIYAATAIPPGIMEGNVRVIKNVVEGGGFIVTNILDEPTAAANILNINSGAVVDIGGGTTGISILKDGKVIYSADEPTGGRHLTLVTAGALNMGYEDAEEYKKDINNYNMVFTMVRPVIEKMSSIIQKHIKGYNIDTIYLVGGTCCLKNIENVVEEYTGVKTVKTYNPLLVTPLGIAISVK
ncbi:ethanolamine utilization protein EutJ [Clostridium estertheticum]|uniref:Chaperone protein DnaK n=2 Tax=Clostridium estertheticum TaxID=238834 RepID=A0A7Y3T023_9CLOT|nr:ethanolamine utilization protein EutJ [Clostridium estertheticum]NNU76924.1 ethanolamine utilization protein EutJ [Clostridium estertheticum]